MDVNWPPFRPDIRHKPGGLGAILKHRLMSDDYRRIELITGTARRRHWTTEQKLQIIEESLLPGETVSSVARRRGVAPNLLYRWRRLMSEGGVAAVGSDEPVVGSSEVRRLEERIRVAPIASPTTTGCCPCSAAWSTNARPTVIAASRRWPTGSWPARACRRSTTSACSASCGRTGCC